MLTEEAKQNEKSQNSSLNVIKEHVWIHPLYKFITVEYFGIDSRILFVCFDGLRSAVPNQALLCIYVYLGVERVKWIYYECDRSQKKQSNILNNANTQ